MFDAHRHLSKTDNSSDALYCTSYSSEWQSLELLTYPAIGGVGALANRPLPSLEALHDYLLAHPLLQVGEIGLDKRFPDREKQEVFLASALDLAYELNRSVTLHIVRSDEKALTLLKRAGARRPILLWHGFTGSLETAKEASRLGCILSLGPSITKTKTGKNLSALSSLPVAVETDYQGNDSIAYSLLLENHYRTLACLLDMDRDALIRKGYECRSILTDNKTPR
ncbi:Mg-dependent DNase [Sphaerochaeta pleomorpha str. Grapes]|uniref:Mg-dependent DNase n=1 Tax=Sphaerochaeta pleomorpha (strain ATCC BAA-1885 / DSM 22778 / Grapes) TaxID=158190 RepID=G8QYN3_SPHPG|nr:TatD family hydrolase [Sphaerochaeta pleomorpha]AEV28596.1 Mg-dependent DNase [Sphaerochaeta pleomorpha str. Grapes]